MASRYAIGIDIGGTKIYAGVVDLATGKVVGTGRKKTNSEKGVAFFTGRLLDVVAVAIEAAALPKDAELVGIGAGIAGQVDRDQGLLLTGPNLAQGLDNLPIGALLSEKFALPVALGNDVEVATYGEQQFGAGKDCDDFVCVFVGTGIGSAIVQNGQLRRGATGTAGEIGHTIVQYNGRLCGCGGRGHLEAYASRTAIGLVLLAEMRRGRPSRLSTELKDGEMQIRSKMLARCIEAGDELVIETLTDAADYLGAGLGSLSSFLNPSRVILGGGLIEATDLLFERATARAREVALPIAGRQLEIVRAALGDDSGIVGAAWMAAHTEVLRGAPQIAQPIA